MAGAAPTAAASVARRHVSAPLLLAALATLSPAVTQAAQDPEADRLSTDWAYLARYREANARLGPPRPGEQRVVFYGNSITDVWARYFDTMFPGKPYVGRGIGGQTTPQMLVRFRQDVIALAPAVVVILAGTNDIAGNTGPATLDMIQDNLASMVELAQAHDIRVVLSSVLPAYDYPWRPGLEPAEKILALNAWMKRYAAEHDVIYLDYHSAMVDERWGLRRELSEDGVHPNELGYRVMAPLVEEAIARALRSRAPGGHAGSGTSRRAWRPWGRSGEGVGSWLHQGETQPARAVAGHIGPVEG